MKQTAIRLGSAGMLAGVTAGILLLSPSKDATAQAFPTKPVTMVSRNPPGSSDVAYRAMNERLTKKWGQPVVMDYRPGAYNIPGIQALLRSPPDGHTVLRMDSGVVITTVLIKVPYELADLAPITVVGYVPQVFVTSAASGIKNVPELLAYTKANPGKLNWGILGSSVDLPLAGLAKKTGLTFTKIPYKGQVDANTAVVTGQVDISILPMPPIMGFVKEGKLRIIATTTPKRMKEIPDVPTMAEFAPGWEFVGWAGIVASAKTPRPLLEIWNRDLREAIVQPEIVKMLENAGYDVSTSSVDEFGALMRREFETDSNYAKDAGMVRQDP